MNMILVVMITFVIVLYAIFLTYIITTRND
ncbi:hypothetical protein LCGC14_0330270 [marine sediment metagenome]|uniref:Uncharacterized protein n=1 Tax=marine sediment metagenome TaxID=412755 RepID=A0A0F9TME8_9ZZZZ